jgi:UDP-N-acetylglucosamine 2-epimerase (non-hydrolysing)
MRARVGASDAPEKRCSRESDELDRMKLLVVVGTRPEAIKMAPVIRRLAGEPECEVRVCVTAQHRQMLDQALALFGIEPDIDLDLMRPDQNLNELASRVFAALDATLAQESPDWLLVQGDTTTAMCASLAAFHRRVRVGHVEAGLRTGDFRHPFPEEMNRRVADLVADVHFVPTRRAAAALELEHVPGGRIFLTGNTVVDALLEIASREKDLAEEDLVLITAHRRESFGEPLERIVRAIGRLAASFPDTRFVHVTHPNPNVSRVVRRNEGLPNVTLVEPVDYIELVRLMRRARLILTDSGGIQEEAPTFGKPVLVLREKTERPEGVEAGLARLVGTDEELIVSQASTLLADGAARRRMAGRANPYGDGLASDRIAAILLQRPFAPFVPPA